jgi:cell wall-associated NlpC family hydrolase
LPFITVLAVGLTMTAVTPTLAYNPTAAAQYADQWSNNDNAHPLRNPAYRSYGDDCTNFVSQALHAGGYPYTGSSKTHYESWYYNSSENSFTWSVAPDLLNFLYYDYPGGYARGYFAPYQGSLSGGSVGDVIFYDWGYGQGVSHSAIQVAYGTDPVKGWVGDLVDTHVSEHHHAIWNLRPYNGNAAITYITVVHVGAGN